MKITFLGASGDVVTGSCYLVEGPRSRIMVDCGMFQGGRKQEMLNKIPPNAKVTALDAVVLTHGHLDHCGRLPLLERAGFKGVIHATPATIEMTSLILRDAAKIQIHDTERQNRKRERAGLEPLEPLYTPDDAEALLRRLHPVPYNKPVEVAPGMSAIFHEAGHMLGSASVALSVTEKNGVKKNVVFSGDIGPRGLPILRDAECFTHADAVILESTYGDRDHRPLAETLVEMKKILLDMVEKRGRILVPAFAVGRTQQMIYHLLEMFSSGEVPAFPIYVDSPMASSASKIYDKHPELHDEETRMMGKKYPGHETMRKYVHETESVDESKGLNRVDGPCLIMAGAGMCNAGRILHHLRHGLWREDTHVLIVGYQAEGTLGRLLVQGRPQVKIFGEVISVKAKVHTMNGFSAHAGQKELADWYGCLANDAPALFLTHGEAKQRLALAGILQERYGVEAWLPAHAEVITL